MANDRNTELQFINSGEHFWAGMVVGRGAAYAVEHYGDGSIAEIPPC